MSAKAAWRCMPMVDWRAPVSLRMWGGIKWTLRWMGSPSIDKTQY